MSGARGRAGAREALAGASCNGYGWRMSDNPAMRPNGVTYLRIPAPDPQQAAGFYHAVFGWTVDASRPDPSFADGTGHVIGHFVADLLVVGEAGVVPYIYVDNVRETLNREIGRAHV